MRLTKFQSKGRIHRLESNKAMRYGEIFVQSAQAAANAARSPESFQIHGPR